MAEYKHALGVGLIPAKKQMDVIYRLAGMIADSYSLSFKLERGVSIPHLTLFQGRFKKEEDAVNSIKGIDFTNLNRYQKISGMSIWAKRIIFLNCARSDEIQKAHEDIYHSIRPLCEGKSADPQNFDGITIGQKKSIEATGYPFSLDEFRPHLTVAHLEDLPEKDTLAGLNKLLAESGIGDSICFEKIVVYRVGEYGRCIDFVYEKRIQSS